MQHRNFSSLFGNKVIKENFLDGGCKKIEKSQ
jgi:hypothetical protein